MTRRQLLGIFGTAVLAGRTRAGSAAPAPAHRTLGRTGRWVTTFGLGGQGALQFPASEEESVAIIVRAIELGINYLDTANAYGPSQSLYGQAFWRLRITPGHPDHDPALRERLFIASKTAQRYALDRSRPQAATAISDLRRALTQMFGDGRGWIPDNAYLDLFQIHNLTTEQQVDQIYEGLEARGGKMPDRIGALAGLLDYRDGTNFTGLNPEYRRWIRHIGITGHLSSPVLMKAIQRDELNILDTLLVALNANDRHYLCHQYNVIPVALARGMGIIAMKVFCAGGIYTGMQRQPRETGELIRTVGVPGGVDSADLIRYPLSVPGVAVVIAGVSHIDREQPEKDQIVCNLAAAAMDVPSEAERRRIESAVAERHGTRTNYFQEASRGLVHPPAPQVEQDGDRVWVRWQTGLAGSEPIRSYKIYSGQDLRAWIPFRPQTTTAPLSLPLPSYMVGDDPVRVEASTEPPPW